MRRSRGIISLSATMALVGMLVVMQYLILMQTEQARRAILRDRSRLEARVLAQDGVEYARSGRIVVPVSGHFVYTSPSIGRGSFTVEIARRGRSLLVRSIGRVDDPSAPAMWTEELSLP